jgi:hypothetical protein
MSKPESAIRDGMIHQAQQERIERDVKIMQKVNHAHREAFTKRFPGQVEHCMRLTAERLQAILTKKPTDLADPETWTSTADEIAQLSNALWHLSVINQMYPLETEDESSKE